MPLVFVALILLIGYLTGHLMAAAIIALALILIPIAFIFGVWGLMTALIFKETKS